MKKILRLFKHDLQRATRNVISVILLFGVVVIPSFFAWFNIISSLDPFDNVKNMKVAVASADEGYKSNLVPLKINVGEQVMSTLRANADLNWVFTKPDDAIDGTKSGEYYAAIVLPKDFSQKMMTFLSPEASPVSIDYYTNEKVNALSPIITGEAATEVSDQINQSFSTTLNNVGLTLVKSMADNLTDPSVHNALTRMSSQANALSSQLHANANTAQMFSALLVSAQPLVNSSTNLVNSSRDAVKGTAGSINGGARAAANLQTTLQAATNSLGAAFSSSVTSYQGLGKQVDTLYATMNAQSKSTADGLNALAKTLNVQVSDYQALRTKLQAQADATKIPALHDAFEQVIAHVDGAISQQVALRDQLQKAAQAVGKADADSQAAHTQINSLVANAQKAIQDANNSYTGTLRPKLNQLASTLSSIHGSVQTVGSDLDQVASALVNGNGSVNGALSQASTVMTIVSTNLTKTANSFGDLSKALTKASQTGDLTELSNLIGSDPSLLAGELAAPVALNTIPLYEVSSFGEQMTPFYSVLGLWVGAILLSVLIRVDKIKEPEPLNHAQQYLGRFGIVALLALCQSTLVYLGLMGFVGIHAAHPFLLLVTGWVMSLVFVSITYTLVVSLGEAGKAVSVFLLVVQISAGGGAYPLSVLPHWFQNISPWLPVTHATNAVRSALAGFYQGDFWHELGILALFFVPTFLFGLLLRIPLIKSNDKMMESLESTKLFLL
ncbi:MAG: YhgE/Pip domain-containing protein [Acidipropionibacterium sp.]|nr:YhgE/Pip domain-containing protein [Acidipropionibacterium sp.]